MKAEITREFLNYLWHKTILASPYKDMTKELDELERLARIGKATEKVFGFSECDDYLAQSNKSHKGEFVITGEVFGSVDDLIDWAESEDI